MWLPPNLIYAGKRPGGIAAGFLFQMDGTGHERTQKGKAVNEVWYKRGYEKGFGFARNEADYDELAAVCRAGGIPPGWDLYRAEILNQHLGDKTFDFKAYANGFTRACVEFFERI